MAVRFGTRLFGDDSPLSTPPQLQPHPLGSSQPPTGLWGMGDGYGRRSQ